MRLLKRSKSPFIPPLVRHVEIWVPAMCTEPCFPLAYFGYSEKKLERNSWCWLVFVYSLWASLTPVCDSGPSEHATDAMQSFFWNQNIQCKNLSFFDFWWLRLLLTLCTYQTYYVFMSTSFPCRKALSRCCWLSFLSWRWWEGHTQTHAPVLTLWLLESNPL